MLVLVLPSAKRIKETATATSRAALNTFKQLSTATTKRARNNS